MQAMRTIGPEFDFQILQIVTEKDEDELLDSLDEIIATLRFREDALRLLRCIRIAGQLGFAIEDETSVRLGC